MNERWEHSGLILQHQLQALRRLSLISSACSPGGTGRAGPRCRGDGACPREAASPKEEESDARSSLCVAWSPVGSSTRASPQVGEIAARSDENGHRSLGYRLILRRGRTNEIGVHTVDP